MKSVNKLLCIILILVCIFTLSSCGQKQTENDIKYEATIYFDKSNEYTFMGDNAVTLTDILKNLDYKPENLCKCLPEYTVDTEFGAGYGINLSEGYARYNGAQADLSKKQVKKLTEIIDKAKDKSGYSEFIAEKNNNQHP